MDVTVVGVGDIGTALAPLFVGAGHRVRLASRRSQEELAGRGLDALLASAAVEVSGLGGAAEGADVVLLAVPYGVAAAALEQVGDLTDRIVVDATNYDRERDGAELDPGPGGSTAVLAGRFPEARWVKGFNMLWAGWLRSDGQPADSAERVVLVGEDDAEAKAVVADLVRGAGFVPFDTGGLADARHRQLEGTPAWNQRLTVQEAARLLPGAPGEITATVADRPA